jgi:Mn2+/Fe2+ NRAMP family transporter
MRVAVYAPPLPTNVTDQASGKPAQTPTPDPEVQGVEYIDMANGYTMTILGWIIWTFIAALNIYLIVMLGLGQS